jgi:hypothetical protein
MSQGSNASRLAKLTLSVRYRKVVEGSMGRSYFPNAGTAGIIEKIRKTVGDKPVYLSIDVRCLFAVCRSKHADSACPMGASAGLL